MTKPSPEDYTQCSVGAMQAAAAMCCLGNANRKQSGDVQDRCRLKKQSSDVCAHMHAYGSTNLVFDVFLGDCPLIY